DFLNFHRNFLRHGSTRIHADRENQSTTESGGHRGTPELLVFLCALCGQFKPSTTIAIPWPPPIHAVASPYFFFRRCNSYNNVITSRVPVAPNGWPSAIAPPLTFTMSRSRPNSFSTARYCAAKASFTSIKSM